jgi:hypothetical protein
MSSSFSSSSFIKHSGLIDILLWFSLPCRAPCLYILLSWSRNCSPAWGKRGCVSTRGCTDIHWAAALVDHQPHS